MPCVICGQDSAGSDICSRCEEIERKWEREREAEQDREHDEERDRFADEECPDDVELDDEDPGEGS